MNGKQCAKCRWCFQSGKTGEYYCGNMCSPFYGEDVEMDDTCRSWEEGESDGKGISFTTGNAQTPDWVR